ncbi:MAG: hypothetical protein K0U19_07800 [Proteobacteria bacterium]|nr:hypothetical protein [Pseudomonadota bacterium]
MPLSVKNLKQGIHYWEGTGWPEDFQNKFYYDMERSNAQVNPNGDFNDDWWDVFLCTLHAWRATRPVTHADLTDRMQQQRDSFTAAWHRNIVPNIEKNIAQVEWSQIEEFCNIVREIKNVDSPVFTSKFCHFLVPQIFPVIDNAAMGKPFNIYQEYYEQGKNDWNNTSVDEQTKMKKLLSEKIGTNIHLNYPFETKIIELCYIGKNTKDIFFHEEKKYIIKVTQIGDDYNFQMFLDDTPVSPCHKISIEVDADSNGGALEVGKEFLKSEFIEGIYSKK